MISPAHEPQEIIAVVKPAQKGWRLDVFLAAQLTDLSRTRIRGLIEDGQVSAEFPLK